ncbi:MAG: Mor transcription activator family protein [Gallionella sp.]|nr:Mor transcription activator family protein [Gallionella sp.]
MTERIVPTAEICVSDLPESIQHLIDIIGFPGALKVVQRYGGGAVFVPEKPDPSHPLAEVMEYISFCKLVYVHAKEQLPIPRCHKAILAVRNQQILKEFLAGRSQRKLAYKFNLTERRIHSIVHRVRLRDDYSGDLF